MACMPLDPELVGNRVFRGCFVHKPERGLPHNRGFRTSGHADGFLRPGLDLFFQACSLCVVFFLHNEGGQRRDRGQQHTKGP